MIDDKIFDNNKKSFFDKTKFTPPPPNDGTFVENLKKRKLGKVQKQTNNPIFIVFTPLPNKQSKPYSTINYLLSVSSRATTFSHLQQSKNVFFGVT